MIQLCKFILYGPLKENRQFYPTRNICSGKGRKIAPPYGEKMGADMAKLTQAERAYLAMGMSQPGGKLPLFDEDGQEIKSTVIRNCVKKGLAERWFANPLKPDWLVCRLTDSGREAIG